MFGSPLEAGVYRRHEAGRGQECTDWSSRIGVVLADGHFNEGNGAGGTTGWRASSQASGEVDGV